jgi:hypothetical protein
MNVAEQARRRRREAAARYRPAMVDTALVVEAPPSALDRYFYFEDVDGHDSLFRHVVRAVLGEEPSRDKVPSLDALREHGVAMLELSEDPFSDASVLPALVPGLIRRLGALRPRRVVLIGVRTYDAAYARLVSAGVPVVDARLPYPGSGQQRRFLDLYASLVEAQP